ncbi:MAG: type VI secretion system tube protein Hcp [Pontiellaceae bacterium]|jgi:type VI secretion system secreted protein Hcp|nr:type VI secretion system tube protein Hcp [Pontiellaceae bacterium]
MMVLKRATIAMVLNILLCNWPGSEALAQGSLIPLGLPGPTMHSLDEIFDAANGTQPFGFQPYYAEFLVNQTPASMAIVGSAQGEIQGSLTNATQNGQIAIIGFDHGITRPYDMITGSLSNQQHRPLQVLKYMDRTSPLLMTAMVNNELLSDVRLRLYMRNAGGNYVNYYTIQLIDAKIEDIRHGFPNLESIAFVYEQITWTYEDGAITSSDHW